MSKQTVQNMKLIILEMDKQISSDLCDYKALRALAFSYRTLLSNLHEWQEDLKDNKLTSDIESQHNAIIKVISELESKSIHELLEQGKHLEVNYLTSANTTLVDIRIALQMLLNKTYTRYNDRVLIIHKDEGKAHAKFEEIIEGNNETLVDFPYRNSLDRETFVTNKHVYEIIKYNNKLITLRSDFAYIDNELAIDEINIVKLHLRNKNNFILF